MALQMKILPKSEDFIFEDTLVFQKRNQGLVQKTMCLLII